MSKSRGLLVVFLVLLAGAGGILFLGGTGVEPSMEGLETPFPGIPGGGAEEPRDGAGPLMGETDGEETSAEGRVELEADLGWGSLGTLTFRGRVVTPGGVPVPSAQVRVLLAGGRRGPGRGRGNSRSAQGVTGEDGSFRIALTGRIPSFWTVTAAKEGLAPDGKSGFSRPGRPVVEVGDLVLGPGGVLSGMVVDRDGRGVPGAKVTWTPRGRRFFGRGIRGLEPPGTVTDQAGLFRLLRVPRGEGKLLALHPDHPPGRSPLIRLQDGTVQEGIRILLPPGYVLEGLVQAEGKGPLEGAEVQVYRLGDGNGGRRGRTPSSSAKTGGDGRFRFTGLPKGTYLAAAGAEGWMQAFHWVTLGDKETPPEPLTFMLTFGRVLEGRVTDPGGAPLELFAVRAVPVKLDPRAVPDPPRDVQRRLRRQGSRSFRRRPTNLRSTGRRSGGDSGGTGQADRERRLKSILDRIRRQRGSVPPGLAERLRNMIASRNDRRGPDPLEAIRSRVTGGRRFRRTRPEKHPGGAFRIQGLLPGVYRVEVEAPGFLRKQSAPLDLTKESRISGVNLTLEPVLSVKGRVVAKETGEPLEGIRVVALRGPSPAGGAARSARGGRRGPGGFRGRGLSDVTDPSGRFTIEGLGPGEWHLVAMGRKYGTAESGTIRLEKGSPPPQVEILLPRGGVIEGRVTGWRPEELSFLLAAAFGPDRRPRLGTVDEQGRFRIEGLSPGTWKVLAAAGDPRRVFRTFFRGEAGGGGVEVRLPEGGKAEVQVPLFRPPWGALSGTLFRGGIPAAGYRIRLVSLEKKEDASSRGRSRGRRGPPGRGRLGRFGGGPSTEVDIQGAFFLPDVESGPYRIEGSMTGKDWFPLGRVEIPVGQTVQVSLTWPVGSVEGMVLMNGVPLPGARVRLRRVRGRMDSGQGDMSFGSSFFETKTDKDGRYKIRDVPPGSYSVEIRGRKNRSRAYFGPILVVQDQVTRKDFLWSVCDLRVQVVEKDSGAPVKRAYVLVRPDSKSEGGRRYFRNRAGFGRTDDKGTVLIRNLQEGDVRILVFSGNYERGDVPLRLVPGGENQVRVALKKLSPRGRNDQGRRPSRRRGQRGQRGQRGRRGR